MFVEESKFTGCDFNETVFKDTVFRRCLLQYANLNGSCAATGDFGRNPADGFRIERMQGAGPQLRAADLTGTNCLKTYFSGTDLTDTGNRGNNPVQGLCRTARSFGITPYQAGGLVKLLGIKVQS